MKKAIFTAAVAFVFDVSMAMAPAPDEQDIDLQRAIALSLAPQGDDGEMNAAVQASLEELDIDDARREQSAESQQEALEAVQASLITAREEQIARQAEAERQRKEEIVATAASILGVYGIPDAEAMDALAIALSNPDTDGIDDPETLAAFAIAFASPQPPEGFAPAYVAAPAPQMFAEEEDANDPDLLEALRLSVDPSQQPVVADQPHEKVLRLRLRASPEQREEEVRRAAQIRRDEELAIRRQAEEQAFLQARMTNAERPIASLPAITPELRAAYTDLSAIIGAKGQDFDVHQLDAFVQTHEGNIHTYLDNYFSRGAALMTLQDIQARMLARLRGFNREALAEHDISEAYVQQAFRILQDPQHSHLIPMFRQIYTLIYGKASEAAKNDAVRSFVSNVNKFKGAYCTPGFRNRMIADFLISIVAPNIR
ncbi:MAG: hypothetical protein LBL99_02120 [Holosporaceae bacterium]|nr:hypothetical protein [Holosporaceae bacterium]